MAAEDVWERPMRCVIIPAICLSVGACSRPDSSNSPLDAVFAQGDEAQADAQFADTAVRAPPGTTRIKGDWTGVCIRNGKSANATVNIDYPNAQLNGVDVSGLSIVKRQISFSYTNSSGIVRTFVGSFGTNFRELKGQLKQSGMTPADCSLSDPDFDANRMCIGSDATRTYHIWLDPPDASTFTIPPGQNAVRKGDYAGRLCYASGPFAPPQCPAVTEQLNYVCGR